MCIVDSAVFPCDSRQQLSSYVKVLVCKNLAIFDKNGLLTYFYKIELNLEKYFRWKMDTTSSTTVQPLTLKRLSQI